MRLIVKKICISLILIFSFTQYGVVAAHEISSAKMFQLMDQLLKQRVSYDKCLEKAQKNGIQPEAEKLCRNKYALQRNFSTEEIYHLYTEHILVASDLYNDLLIAVHGKVHRVGESGLGFPEVLFAIDGFGLTGVRFEFPNNMAKEIAKLKVGDSVTIGGISKGLFNDKYVRITHCEFLNDTKNKRKK